MKYSLVLLLLCLTATGIECLEKKKNLTTVYYDYGDGARVLLQNYNFSNFHMDGDTVILIHGAEESEWSTWILAAPVRYRRREQNYNVIVVSWKDAANCVLNAMWHAKAVGKEVAELIESLMSKGVDLKKIHLVGYNEGAQVAGFAGKIVKKKKNIKIGRITGLDPLATYFPSQVLKIPRRYRLAKTDADMVDVLHTSKNFGFTDITDNIGTVDFYANYGTIAQPGCISWKLEDLLDINKNIFRCSAKRSVEFFVESISSKKFIASTCKTKLFCKHIKYMVYGEDTPKTAKGKYYFNTRANEPYALGALGTVILNETDFVAWQQS